MAQFDLPGAKGYHRDHGRTPAEDVEAFSFDRSSYDRRKTLHPGLLADSLLVLFRWRNSHLGDLAIANFCSVHWEQ